MKENDKRKILKRIIGLCWFSLILCMVIKLFGGNYFEIASKNETFVNVCNWIDNNFVKEIIRFMFLNGTFYLYCSSIMRRRLNWKGFLFSHVLLIIVQLVKYSNSNLGFLADCIMLFFIPFMLSRWKLKNCIIGFLLINAFQLISLFTRNINIGILEESIFVEILLQVDYYIMLILYYLYSVKLKGEKING